MSNPPPLPPNDNKQPQSLSHQTQRLLDKEMQHLPPQYNQGYFALLTEPRPCDAGRGIAWLTQAWKLFKSQWLKWLLVFWAVGIVFGVLGLIPIVDILISLVSFNLVGGFILMAAEQANGRDFGFETFLTAFTKHFVPLFLLTIIYFAVMVAAIMVLGIIAVALITAMGISIDAIDAEFLIQDGFLWVVLLFLVGMLVVFLMLMATWFAPALMILHGVKVIDAMKMSFKGCLKNILPFLVYSLVGGTAVVVIAILTLGLALIPLLPILTMVYYTSYRDVWTEEMMRLP